MKNPKIPPNIIPFQTYQQSIFIIYAEWRMISIDPSIWSIPKINLMNNHILIFSQTSYVTLNCRINDGEDVDQYNRKDDLDEPTSAKSQHHLRGTVVPLIDALRESGFPAVDDERNDFIQVFSKASVFI